MYGFHQRIPVGTRWATTRKPMAWSTSRGTRRRSNGSSMRGEGSTTFLDHDRMEWTWTERGAVGKMELKGTSKRQPP